MTIKHILGCIGLVAACSIPGGGTSAAPDTSSLADLVTIRRDTYGVPHILAETEEAAAFGMGYAQAEDHSIEIARRFVGARGEEARHLGTGTESDFRMKRYGNYTVAKASFGKLSPLFRKMMNAYAAGLNLYVEKHRSSLPAWIPKFDGVDVLARGRAEVMRFAFREGTIRAVQAKYPADGRTGEIPSKLKLGQIAGADGAEEETSFGGSNMWALAGSRTVSGKTILLGNPHQPWSALYWEAHLTVPGKINFFGGTFVGRPLLTTGFNEHLGWTHTVNNVDLDDIYVLTLDSMRENHYLFEGKSMAMTPLDVAVEIREPDGSIRTERRKYWDSHLGPIVHRTADKAFAMKSAILDAYRYYEEWYALSKARNLREFREALSMNAIPMFNLSYADVEGNILYVWNGTLPRRLDDGMDYSLDVPGDTGKYVWKGFHALEELPQLLNPAGGYVQNCNDPPWWTSLRDPLDPKSYPSYIEPGRQLGLRTQMSLAMLERQEKFSLDEVKRLKFNTKMLLAERVKPDLLKALSARANASEELRAAGAVLESWDNRVSSDSRGAVLFQRFWDTYSAEFRSPFAAEWDPKNPARTPLGLKEPGTALRHLEAAVRWTRKTWGSEKIAWGEAHRIRLGSLDLPGDGAGGEYGLFRVMSFGPSKGGKRVAGLAEYGKPFVGGGDGWIMAIEFSQPVKAYSVLAYGQTSDPASRHSTDQAKLFANHAMKKVWFTEAEIAANLERSYRPGR